MRSSRRGRATTLALALGGFAFPASAFQPLVTDDTGTQGKGGNQIEFSVDQERAREAGQTTRTRTRSLAFTFTRGLTDALDVFAGVSQLRIRSNAPGVDASGHGNPVLGLKWRFFGSEPGKTSVALKPEVLLPLSETGERQGLGNGRTSWGLTLVVSHELGFGAIHANVGVGRNRLRDPLTPASHTTAASIAPVWKMAPHWQLALDLGYQGETAGGVTTRSRFAEFAASYSPSETLDIAIGVIRGTNSAAPRATASSATVGVTWRFP